MVDVIVEKPIANTLDDAQAIVELASRYGAQVFVAENYRYQGFLDKVKDLTICAAGRSCWRLSSR